jgi:RNA polymerase sigma-70 factor (ECF subfamily)
LKTEDPAVTRELLAGAQAGDAAATDALLRRYTPFVLRVVGLRMGEPLRNVLEREDLVQEALLHAFQSLERFEHGSEGSFKSWLATIVARRVSAAWREQKTQRRGDGRERPFAAAASSLLSARLFPGGGPTPSADAAARELEERIESALLALPERERRAIELRRLCGLEYAEVAAELELATEGAARALVARALTRLAERL